jgi:hypothetical protein
MPEFLMTDSGVMKRCPHCKAFKPYTPEWFAPVSSKLYKVLRAECRDCQKAYRAKYREEHGK